MKDKIYLGIIAILLILFVVSKFFDNDKIVTSEKANKELEFKNSELQITINNKNKDIVRLNKIYTYLISSIKPVEIRLENSKKNEIKVFNSFDNADAVKVRDESAAYYRRHKNK